MTLGSRSGTRRPNAIVRTAFATYSPTPGNASKADLERGTLPLWWSTSAWRMARAATAQARFTARLVLVLPAGAAALAELASPGLIAGLLDHPLSVWLVGMAVVLQVIAIAAVARLARVR